MSDRSASSKRKSIDVLVVVVILVLLTIVALWVISREEPKKVSKRRLKRDVGKAIEVRDATMKALPVSASIPSETLPTFLRNDGRIIVAASKIRVEDRIELPKNFDARERWPGWITNVMDQGACGSCWSFSSSGVFGDRIKIASEGRDMPADDAISQYHVAACMKCTNSTNTVCKSVCSGHYMDEVLEFMKKKGAYSTKAINSHTNNGTQYICFKPTPGQEARLYKASNAYRVNPYDISEISSNSEKRASNEYSIMHDIFTHGPVTATIKVFDPVSPSDIHRNLYLYEKGIYGTNWGKTDPKETDGYHAIAIIGWGEESGTKYWLIRNSWGPEWGQSGYGKVLRGENRAIIESDLWAMHY